MKKRIISLLLIVCMAFSLTVVASAEDEFVFDSTHIICTDNHTTLTVNAETISEYIPEYAEWVANETVTYKWQYVYYDFETETDAFIDIPNGTAAKLTEFDTENYSLCRLIISGGDGSMQYESYYTWLPQVMYFSGYESSCVFEGEKPHYQCWHCDGMWFDEELTQPADYEDLIIPVSSDNCAITHFTDAPKTTNWAHNGIEYCVEYALMNGTSETTFEPNKTTNRAMLVTVLYRMMGEPSVDGLENPFTDLKKDSYYEDAVIWAASEDIVTGTTATTFEPNANITREQTATILYRFAQYIYGDHFVIFEDAIQDIEFPDEDKVSNYAKDAVKFMTGAGVINGVARDGASYIDPKGEATRAQIATILQRFDNIYLLITG